jgi:hypothetical protein
MGSGHWVEQTVQVHTVTTLSVENVPDNKYIRECLRPEAGLVDVAKRKIPALARTQNLAVRAVGSQCDR